VYLFGIVFAPIFTPHVAERVGRSIIYLVAVPLCGLFLLGAGFSQTFAGVAILRFLAGLTGGPCLVLLEGTFADIWSAKTTNTYYAFQSWAQFVGTALGPIVGGYLVEATDGWRWTQWTSAAVCAFVWVFAFGMSESYQREIPRRRAKRQGRKLEQDPALSGVTFGEMFKITVLDPIRQVFLEPVVTLCTFFLIFNFAVVLQFFITVPVALGSAPPAGPGFTPHQVGLAFTTAIAGSGLAGLIVIMIDQVISGTLMKKQMPTFAQIEYRLIPAMIGPLLVTAALFWIGKLSSSLTL
jgi:MFS transporter, DHA1 family, multidrug resistance protein